MNDVEKIIYGRLEKLQLLIDFNIVNVEYFDDFDNDVGNYKILAQQQNRMMKDEIKFLEGLLRVVDSDK